jgi:large subunit ribosomal protein L4
LLPEKNDDTQKVYLSTRNLPDAKTLMASYINIRDLMTFDRLILPLPALDVLVSVLK